MLKIYAAGGKSKPLDIKNNAANAQAEIEKAKYSGAKMVVFPQGFLTGVQLGMLADAHYMISLYRQVMESLAKANPDMYILGDVYTKDGFMPMLYLGEQCVDARDFELGGLKFTCFSSARELREKAAEISCDCIILTESSPVLAGSRQLLKDLLVAVQSATGATVFANLGGYGFTSHPDVYLPAIAYINNRETFFTTTLPQFIQCEKCYSVDKAVAGSGMLGNLPKLDFDIAFNQNPLIPAQINTEEYC
ncbi:MAG: hypothetical protein J6K80_01255, partial [Oscillospiraceae bacterium]|nr:hypothetical protein [Oscillospiraceae bacterium]